MCRAGCADVYVVCADQRDAFTGIIDGNGYFSRFDKVPIAVVPDNHTNLISLDVEPGTHHVDVVIRVNQQAVGVQVHSGLSQHIPGLVRNLEVLIKAFCLSAAAPGGFAQIADRLLCALDRLCICRKRICQADCDAVSRSVQVLISNRHTAFFNGL